MASRTESMSSESSATGGDGGPEATRVGCVSREGVNPGGPQTPRLASEIMAGGEAMPVCALCMDSLSPEASTSVICVTGNAALHLTCAKIAVANPQGPAQAAPVVDQGPQVHSPLLIPPLNQLAQLRAAGAHGENAENAQEEAAQGLRMLDQRKITAAIMKLWAPHVEARALGPPHLRGQVMHQRQLSQIIPCISRTVEGQLGHSLL